MPIDVNSGLGIVSDADCDDFNVYSFEVITVLVGTIEYEAESVSTTLLGDVDER